MRIAASLLLAVSLAAASGCATYREDLNRGQRLYQNNDYDRALAIWRVLEADLDSLTYGDQARYAYFRGMTAYRLGPHFRADARHWLAIAKAVEKEHPGGLTAQWKSRIDEALEDLNADWHRGGKRDEKSRSTAEVKTEDPGEGEKPAGGGCSSNADCPEGNVCQASECVPL